MIAELEGRVYENADTVRPVEDEAPVDGTPREPCAQLGCGCLAAVQFLGSFCLAHSSEVSDGGPEFRLRMWLRRLQGGCRAGVAARCRETPTHPATTGG